MRREITKAEIDAIFDEKAGYTHQQDVLIALYRLTFPDWDKITAIASWPKCGAALSRYIWDHFVRFDTKHHPKVMHGGLWFNSGWSTDKTMPDWEVTTEHCQVTYDPTGLTEAIEAARRA